MNKRTFVLYIWSLLVLYTSHAAASTAFGHAWQQYCTGREGECSGAHIPHRAYAISLPDDVEKRDYLLPQLKTMGFDVETVDGILSDQVYPCLPRNKDRNKTSPNFWDQPSRKRHHLSAVASLCAKAGNAVECVGTLKCTAQQAKQGRCLQLGDDFTRCEAAMTSGKCQAGLTRAHISAWRRIVHSGEAAAWVFE